MTTSTSSSTGGEPTAPGDGAGGPDGAAATDDLAQNSSSDHATNAVPCGATDGIHLSVAWQRIAGVLALVVFGIVFLAGRLFAVPGPLEFWKVTAQPVGVVTAGLLAVLAAGITFRAQRRTSDSATESAREDREKDIRAEALERCWTRFLWLASDREGREVLPYEVELELIAALSEEAARWQDEALKLFIAGFGADFTTDVRSEVEAAASSEDD